jgi:hypothetical protein
VTLLLCGNGPQSNKVRDMTTMGVGLSMNIKMIAVCFLVAVSVYLLTASGKELVMYASKTGMFMGYILGGGCFVAAIFVSIMTLVYSFEQKGVFKEDRGS